MGPERAVHNRERSFHDTETEAGFLQVRENESKTDLRISSLGECSVKKKATTTTTPTTPITTTGLFEL